jgi:hypothetical protein
VGGPGIGVVTALGPGAVEDLVLVAMGEEGFVPDGEPRSYRDRLGLPYGYAIQPGEAELEPEQLQRVKAAIGLSIVTEAVVMAYVADVRCRAPLARLALRIATATGGWVDVDGDISRPYGREPITGLTDYLNRGSRCTVIDGSYYLDPAAMLAWLRHPRFHVIQ